VCVDRAEPFVAVYCRMLQCLEEEGGVDGTDKDEPLVAVCHSVLQCVVMCCSVLLCSDVAHVHHILEYDRAVRWQCVAVCVVQCVAVWCRVLQSEPLGVAL